MEEILSSMGRKGVKSALLLVAYANVASCFSPNFQSIRFAGRGTASSAFPASCGPRVRRLGLAMAEAGSPGDLVETIGGFALQVAGAWAVASVVSSALNKAAASNAPPVKSIAEGGVDWDALLGSGKLSREAFRVLKEHGTERPFTSPLLQVEDRGTFSCAACGSALFDADTKFDSGTGWPSFYDVLDGVELEEGNQIDQKVNMRQECHCAKCGGHLGHVFPDGVLWKVPTGKRYCINGVSLTFKPKVEQDESMAEAD